MSRKEKLLLKLLSKPKTFTYNELESLLRGFGYQEIEIGKTSGSRAAFYNEKTKLIIRLHKPHPSNILKKYQLDLIEQELKNKGIIK